MYKRDLLTVILTSLVLAGCSDSDTPATTGTSTPVGGGGVIDGTWKTGCRGGGDVSSTHEFVALNGNMQSIYTFFDDPNCTVLQPGPNITENSTYTLGDLVTVDGSVGGITSANKIDNIGGSSTEFDIVGITSNGTTLYFGDFFTGDGDTDATRSTQLDNTEPYTLQTDTTAVSAKYEGTYLQACTSDDDEDEPGFEVTTVTIAGTIQTIRILDYTDAACTLPDAPAEIVVVESLVYPGGTVQTPLGLADFVDNTTVSVTLDGQPPSAELTQELTQDGFFNTEYDLFLLVGSSLFFGENTDLLDGESAANRPITLESDPIIRQ